MQTHRLIITAEKQPAILEQLLRVIRFRGFEVSDMKMRNPDTASEFNIEVCVNSERPIHKLENQLKKLVDVKQVFVENSPAV